LYLIAKSSPSDEVMADAAISAEFIAAPTAERVQLAGVMEAAEMATTFTDAKQSWTALSK
jgi:hypothetical protein